ncbi:MAG: hypothetical protein VZR09_09695, partial [Candidatus Gastranaerophilaceae bacterium]|nr:hypothetical protein [Candidatus Gastranaerophilaceae bacterium]
MLIRKNIKKRIKNLLSRTFVFSAVLGMTTFGVQAAETVSPSEYISDTAHLSISSDDISSIENDKKSSILRRVKLNGVVTGGASYSTLNGAVSAEDAEREYTLPVGGETISAPLGDMGGASSTLTIDGTSENHYGIKGGSNAGITTGSGQTLILKNIGSVTVNGEGKSVSDYVINSAINGFVSATNGGFVNNNGGTLTINDTVFSNNNAAYNNSNGHGGAIYNIGSTANITEITNVSFVGNRADFGAAIANGSGASIGNITADFVNNQGGTGHSHGVAIYNVGGSEIGNIQGKFVGNTINANFYGVGVGIYNTASTIGNISGEFYNNSVSGDSVMGSVIFNDEGAEIGDISGTFEGNTATSKSYVLGGIINNGYNGNSTIGDISANFKNNTITANCTNGYIIGALIETGASTGAGSQLGDISGTFEGNTANGDDGVYGGIYNDANATMGNITGTFRNNALTGGTVYGFLTNDGGTINKIQGAIFKNNSANGLGSYGLGGAIVNDGTITEGIINSKFIGNHATSVSSAAQGGAIYTAKDLSIIADGSVGDGISTFQGNYTQVGEGAKNYEAIRVSGASKTLTLDAKNGGTLNLYDYITGSSGYTTSLTGDSDSTINLYNDIKNSNVVVDAPVNVNMANDDSHGYNNFTSLTLNSDMNLSIDADLKNTDADKITATTLTANGKNIIINAIHIMTDAEGSSKNITLTSDPQFEDVLKLSDDILSNITKATGVTKSYSATYSNFGKWADDSDSGLDADKGILVFNSLPNTLANTIVELADVKVYILPDTNEEVEKNLSTLVGQSLTITGNNKEIHANDYNGMTLGTGANNQALYVNDVADISGFTTPFITNGENGTVTINNSVFTNNKSLTEYVDVYNSGTINLNAASGKTVTFNGAVIGDDGTLVINNDPTVKGGEYIFNSTLGGTLDIHNSAIIRLGSKEQENGSTTYGVLALTGFHPQGGTVTLDLRNDHIDTHHFGNVIQDASVDHWLDIDLDAKTSDRFTADSTTAVSGDILIGKLNLISGSGDDEMVVNLSKNSFRFAMSLTPNFSIENDIRKATGVTYDVRTLDYDFLSGNFIFNAKRFNPNGGTVDMVYKTSRDYLELGKGNHATYNDFTTSPDANHTYVVILNGNIYYFKPNESTEKLNDAIIDLAATGSLAIKQVTSNDDYIFELDGKYYTYSVALLPKSIWEEDDSNANAGNYHFYEINGTSSDYHNIVLRTDFMNAVDTTTWTASDAGTAATYDWANDKIPLASDIKPVIDGEGNLTNVSGMIRFDLPLNQTETDTKYYKYDYTVPYDYTKAPSRLSNLENYITNQYFYNFSNAGEGGAISNSSTNGFNINADFISNTSISHRGGAIYNAKNASLGFISGTFINNAATGHGDIIGNGGVFMNDTGGTVRAIMGDFIGNKAGRSAGVIRNDGIIDIVQGQFIGNRAGINGDGWGGVISNKATTSKIEVVLGNFIANSASKGGGAIDMNGTLGTVIGDFIGNSALAGDNGGGAVRIEDGYIGSLTGDFIGNTAIKGGAVLVKGSGEKFGTLYGKFIGNKATAGDGGSIYVEDASSNMGAVYGEFTNNTATANGGAIYNKGEISRLSANFIANKADSNGGAIYNDGASSIVKLVADPYGNILFTDNKAGSSYNDIYNNGGKVELNALGNANENYSITFNGEIDGANGIININNDSVIKGGEYIFNNTIRNNAINIYNDADIKLGSVVQSDDTTTYGTLALTGLTNDTNGGAIDSRNGHLEYHNLGAVNLSSDLNLKLDADLANPITVDTTDYYTDTYYANSFTGSGKLIIKNLLINTQTDEDSILTKVGNNVLVNHIALASDFEPEYKQGVTKSYIVSLNHKAGDGVYFNFEDSSVNLVSATRSNKTEVAYHMKEDENITTDLGVLELMDATVGTQAGNEFVITGNGYNVDGAGNEGITTGAGKTITINKVGIDTSGTQIGNGFFGFEAGNGSVLRNSGTATLNNNVFANNEASVSGGAIYNAGTLNFGGTNIFSGNTAAGVANDIYNTGAIHLTENSITNINSGISGADGTISMASNAVLNLGGEISNNSITMGGGTINLLENGELNLEGLTGTPGNSLLNTVNGSIEMSTVGNLKLTNLIKLALDVDLTGSGDADKVIASTVSGGCNLLISSINLIAGEGSDKFEIALTTNPALYNVYSLSSNILSNITKAAGVTYNVNSVVYDNTTGILTFNGITPPSVGPTLDTVKAASTEYLGLGTGNHQTYDNLVTTKDASHPDIVVIGNTTYFFKADESAYNDGNTEKIRNLAATGWTALKEVTASEDYIFKVGGKYYSYTASALPDSIWQTQSATPSNFDFEVSRDNLSAYYNFNFKNNDRFTWTNSGSSESVPVWHGDTNTATGTIKITLPHTTVVGDTSTTARTDRYYTYTYTMPSDYEKAESRNTSGTADVINQLFIGFNSDERGGAMLLTDRSIDTVKADFIGNTSSNSGAGSGAIGLSNATRINRLIGNFIYNTATAENGGAIGKGGTATIGNITGNFIANRAKKSAGAIYTRNELNSITGDFIGNIAETESGGAIWHDGSSSPSAKKTIDSITGDFIGNIAGKDAGAIILGKNAAKIGTITGNFIGNYAGRNGGALYVNSNDMSIDKINADFLSNSAVSSAGAIYNNGTITAINGNFTGNSASGAGGAIINKRNIGSIEGDFTNNSAKTDAGAIYNEGTITALNGNFAGNSAKTSSGAIYNKGTISSIEGDFTDNKANSAGAIFNYLGTITAIDGKFVNNVSITAGGGAIKNNNHAAINTIAADFINNKSKTDGGAIHNASESTIGLISGDFTGNSAVGHGGAIYNVDNDSAISDIINAKFLNNFVQTTGGSATVQGGAIYTKRNMKLTADGSVTKNNGVSTISGNYVSNDGGTTKNYEAIYVGDVSADVTLNAINGGEFVISDYINGVSGYTANLTGDSTGIIGLYNDVRNGNVTVTDTAGTVSLANDTVHNYQMRRLNSDAAAKWSIDINPATAIADNITTSVAGTGTLTINNFNLLDGKTFSDITDDHWKVQILHNVTGNNELQLGLSAAAISQLGGDTVHKVFEIIDTETGADAVTSTTHWDDNFYNWHIDNATEHYGVLGLSMTDTTNDSIGYTEDHTTYVPGTRENDSYIGDALTLVNTATIGDREFSTTDAGAVYNLGSYYPVSGVGTTGAGVFTISGAKTDTSISTIDLQAKTGFVVSNASTLNLNDVKIQNATGAVVTLNNANAGLNVTSNSVIAGDVTNTSGTVANAGSITGAVDNSGTFTNSGIIGGALSNGGTFTNTGSIAGDVDNSGTLTSSVDGL